MDELTSLIAKLTGVDFGEPPSGEDQSSFAKRQLTGVAAENFFLLNHKREDAFHATEVRDMTKAGCGYDFSLHPVSGGRPLAVEVKGLGGRGGEITMTAKEYDVAAVMSEQYFLYVVTDLDASPKARAFQNPLLAVLSFQRVERIIEQVTWQTRI